MSKFHRSSSDKKIAGVCGGLSETFNVDSTIIRLIFAITFVFGCGSPFIIYMILWIIMPEY